jgi:hypothetical protein
VNSSCVAAGISEIMIKALSTRILRKLGEFERLRYDGKKVRLVT